MIGAAAARSDRSIRKLAANVGISDARWRQVVAGYRSEGGRHMPVRANPKTLARMAAEVGVTAEELRAVGRDDAADELIRTGDLAQPVGPGEAPAIRPQDQQLADLISQISRLSISETQRLELIEQVVALHQAARERPAPSRAQGDQRRDGVDGGRSAAS